MVMDGLLVVRFERNLKNPEPVVLEQDLVVGRAAITASSAGSHVDGSRLPWSFAMAFSLVGSPRAEANEP